MPFTISHTAAVLPFGNQRRLPFSALFIGAMIPDYPLFVPFRHYHLSHSFSGLFLYDLPVGVLVYLLWSRLLSRPTQRLLPVSLVEAFPEDHNPSFVRVSVAIVLGAFTHVFWDGFTHSTGFALPYLPFLRTFEFAALPLYKLLQWGCSVLGLIVIAWWLFKRRKKRLTTPESSYPLSKLCCWLVLVLASFLVGVQAAFVQSGKLILYYGIVAFLKTFLLLWCLLCFAILWMSRTPQHDEFLQQLLQEQR